MEWLVKGGLLQTPQGSSRVDLRIQGETIIEMGEDLDPGQAQVVSAQGLWVLPGLIDMHTHLREPGREDEETIATGTRAAVAGGFTAICAMPNTDPVCDSNTGVKYLKAVAELEGACAVYPIAAITMGQAGKHLVEMVELVRRGAVAFSDDGHVVTSPWVMRNALQYSRHLQAPLIQHAEDPDLVQGGVAHEGAVATRLGLPTSPASAEEIIVARDLILAEETGGRIHFAHISTQGSIRLIREAKSRGVRVTCEVTPHHLALTDEALEGYSPNLRVNPPLRSREHQEALIQGIIDGTIDAIATDHAPHAPEEKDHEFGLVPPGMIGLETAWSLAYTTLVEPGHISVGRLIQLFTQGYQILGLPGGELKVGSPADLTLVDPRQEWTVDPTRLFSKSKNTPFAGWRLKTQVVRTYTQGAWAYRSDE